MFRISRLQSLLQLVPWGAFDRSVRQHRSDRHCKGFDSRDHLVSMLFAQLSDVHSLRELELRFNQHHRQRYHLGVDPIRRSTLAEANARRNPHVFAALAQSLMNMAGRGLRREREFMLYLLDSTSIVLAGRGFEWTARSATRTPGVKLHLLYEAGGCHPVHHSITAANVNDVGEGAKIPIQPGATYVFDKGYCDYGWWSRISAAGARWVTRPKSNAALRPMEHRPIDAADAGEILSDDIMRFAHASNRGGHRNPYTSPVRRIEVARPGKTALVLLTNDLASPASEISRLYKDRWQIELFFKWIKQHLQVKRFLGRSENAVHIQLLVALIAYLLVLLYKARHGLSATRWAVLAELRGGLMHPVEPSHSAYKQRKRQRAEAAAAQGVLL
ncbi:MAG TPA: IS4 family transposase [Anaerolineales bacterium]